MHKLQESPIDWGQFIETGEIRYEHNPLVLRPHQEDALRKVVKGLNALGSRGKLIMACGTGKTLTALRVAEELAGQGGRVLYLVPSLALMSQTIHAWTNDAQLKLRAFAVCSDSQVGKRQKSQDDNIDMDALDLAWPATTDSIKLAEKAKSDDPEAMTIFFATYQSSSVIERAQREFGLPSFDLAICDEAHRTAGAIVDQEEQSGFTRIHCDSCIQTSRRLYMTATPKIYSESARERAGELATALCSMDDEGIYGSVLYEIGFAAAVEQDLLSDYRVIVLTISENLAAQVLAHFGGEFGDSLKIDDAALMIGCWRALAKADRDIFPENEREPMKRAIAFCRTIRSSQQLEQLIKTVGQKYRSFEPGGEASLPAHDAPARHIDGTHNAGQRAEALKWLDSPEQNECRILTNARCLTEGVDLPSLDGILFMHPRKSQIEVVQAVGRVMRKAEGKKMGYIILPVVVAPGASAKEMLDDNERWRKVWQMLNAIRSHDEGFDAEVNRIEKGEDPKRITIITVVDWQAEKDSPGSDEPGIGLGDADGDSDSVTSPKPGEQIKLFDALPGAIKAKIVEKCGSRKYWDEWAGDVAKIARAHIERITAMVTIDATNQDNPDIRAAAEMFDGFVKELQDDLNSGITREDAIEMLAQHKVTGPVFDALFEVEAFTRRNPVSQAMQNMLDVIKPSDIDIEAENLEDFYESVKRRAKGATSDEAKQQIIAELYDKFFRNAFAETSKALGIVYTPVEVVDFILHSVEHVLKGLDANMSDEGVNILDPFTGTGTFITRLLQSGLIKDADIERKFDHEIHANEIVLLAYYIAAVNIESVFHAKKTHREYRPFEHICLADTFRMNERGPSQESLIKDSLKENSERRSGQKDLDIRVIVGNPPWMSGKKEPGYPKLYSEIEETYAACSTATLKNSLYDSYKLAIRWASDRIGDRGVIGFVTNGSWIQGHADSGIRACLAKEFSSVHVLDLRGNARMSGELRRAEGDNVFGHGSRAPVAIMILVKNPAAKGCRILYRDVGDYLSREDKLEKLVEWESIAAINDWQEISPDSNHDWINKRESGFDELLPLGSKKTKAGKASDTVFQLYSSGYKTSRDAYLYNFSLDSCAENARLMIEDYSTALTMLGDNPTVQEAKIASKQFTRNIHWDRELKNNLARKKKVDFSSVRIWKIQYRPFVKQHCYVEYTLVNMKYQQDRIFPEGDTENRAICMPGIGSSSPFSVLMVDHMPDLGLISASQCFPRYRFENPDEQKQNSLFRNRGGHHIDNITDYALDKFQSHYQGLKITKDDIFDYVYGVLHAPDFRDAFPNSLSKELARVPLASDFWAFAKAGHELGDLHVGYEHCPEYPLELEFSGNGDVQAKHLILGTKAMHYGKFEGGGADKSILVVNEYIHLSGIPDEAHQYIVNGHTPLGWLIDRYKITTDRKSGKVNDPNAWFEKPEDLISSIRRIVYLSVETTQIVRSLPKALPKQDPK